MQDVMALVERIAQIGAQSPMPPEIGKLEPFAHFFERDGRFAKESMDRRDGSCTRRELLLRFLVLNAVLDQGPDTIGVRDLLITVTNHLYRREVRFLHSPIAFFQDIGIAVDQILEKHRSIREARSDLWAAENRSTASKYNLFMDGCKQVLNYAVFRWGVPLALPLLLDRDERDENRRHDVLLRYLKGCRSAEEMSQQLKDNKRYGLGKAIGDKACHLFAKWTISSFGLLRESRPNWDSLSFEIPFDSNAGRVLWRTGFFLRWAEEAEYVKSSVVQKGRGKGGAHYIRVTNIRGMKTRNPLPADVWDGYVALSRDHLCTHKRAPKTIEIQRIPHAFLMASGTQHGIAEFDDGLMHIGTRYCLNHEAPRCGSCPVGALCEAGKGNPHLITDYRT